ncbi:MAG: hypothetical protein HY064_01725 [Bacteroidetes bacterium]|nr:hypothetical protein [Bacteroidota bacterium]
MKTVLLVLGALLPFFVFADANDSAAIDQTFIHASGKTNLYVLQLKNDARYDYCRYTNKKTYHDWGIYSIVHGKISFESKNRRNGFNSVGGKTYFFSKKGMYKTRMDRMMKKKSVLEFSDDPDYKRDWAFNPIAGRSLEEDKTKTKPEALTAEKRKAVCAAYAKKYFLGITADYASPYRGMLDQNYCGPDCYSETIGNTYLDWNLDTSATKLFSDFETVIHESTHHVNSDYDGGMHYLVEPGIIIKVPVTDDFHSSEFKNIVPKGAAEKIFRYNTYVSDSSIVSANVSGIYGLLDEYSAYNAGVRASTLAAQSALQKGDTALASQFISQASGTYFAYYEFNLFTAWYLHEAKIYHPETYTQLMANTDLRVVYTLLDSEFSATVDNFKRTSAIIEKSTATDYYSYNETTYAAYPKQLLVKEKPYLDNFRVKGVTTTNYFTFLK